MKPVPAPHQVMSEIQEAVLSYVDTAYWLRDPELRRRAPRALGSPGTLFQDPLLEPVLPYPNKVAALQVCQAVGLTERRDRSSAQERLRRLGRSDMKLRPHQADALRISLLVGEGHPVVTSGTGSGKTETFLLPLVARHDPGVAGLVIDRSRDTRGGSSRRAVDAAAQRRRGPPPSRAIVLYPMNALVEDQIARLRRTLRRIMLWVALDSGSAATPAPPGRVQRMPDRGRAQRLDEVAARSASMVRDIDKLAGIGRGPPVADERPAAGRDGRRAGTWSPPRRTSSSRTTRCST